jgi:energy-coupling factor transporter ATP-binding protein EcfA2
MDVSAADTTRSLGAVTGAYEERSRRYAERRDVEQRRSAIISRLRLATFLPAAACLIAAFRFEPVAWLLASSVVLFLSFATFVVWHARVEERVAWNEALRLVNVHGVARVTRTWSALPAGDAPSSVDLANHPYARDLDLFGRASLFQWLGPAATVHGRRALAEWLLRPPAVEDVVARQDAVAALASEDDWREALAAHGILAATAREEEIDNFLRWAEGPPVFGPYMMLVQIAVLGLTASIWTLAIANAIGTTEAAWWLIPLLAGLILSFACARRIQFWLDRAGAGQHALVRYAAVFEHAIAAPRSAARLHAIRNQLAVQGAAAPACMRRLNRILGFGAVRQGAAILHFPIQALTLWDFHVIFALERWRLHVGTKVRGWFQAVGELDALAALARIARDNPEWCVPRVEAVGDTPSDGSPDRSRSLVIRAERLGHPLIAAEKRVPNDVQVGPQGTLLLITGSNMSGKSTLLRAIGLNVILAQAGSTVCAARLSLPPCDLQTSIRVQDSLELGLSYFMAALARLKGVVDAAEHERPGRALLYLLDEILQGTNSVERGLAVRAVARHLLDAGAIGAMTTHDLSVASEEPLATAAQLVHFTEIVDEHGEMHFDYQLRPGLATSRNALRLMQMIGISVDPERQA